MIENFPTVIQASSGGTKISNAHFGSNLRLNHDIHCHSLDQSLIINCSTNDLVETPDDICSKIVEYVK